MPERSPTVCTCGRLRHVGQACPCGVGDAAKRKAFFDARRATAAERGYDTRWRRAREGFLRDHPACAFCGRPANVVDHIQPHRGDQALFWLRTNWQSLCTPCHSGAKQAQERAELKSSPDAAGPGRGRVVPSTAASGDRREGEIFNSGKTGICSECIER